jgi:hypothetical protein
MESEYIRGKLEERAGAVSARPSAQFSARGNDVWAHRSGRTYQPAVGGQKNDFSSPVTGNGKMGDLSRLVGGKKRQGAGFLDSALSALAGPVVSGVANMFGNQQTSAPAEKVVARMDSSRDYGRYRRPMRPEGRPEEYLRHFGPGPRARDFPEHFHHLRGRGMGDMSAKEAHELVNRDYRGGGHPYLTKGGAVRAKYRGSGLWDDIKGLAGKVVHEFTDPQSDLRKKIAPTVAKYGKYLDFVPGLEGVGTAVSTAANFLATPEGGSAYGGAEHMMSPMEAQQLMMMDYRGGAHPYLTKSGRVRASMKGSGVWDNVKRLASRAANEVFNPQSRLRGEILPAVAQYAPYADYVAPGVGTTLGATARGLADSQVLNRLGEEGTAFSQGLKKAKAKKAGDTLEEIASRGIQGKLASARSPPPSQFMASPEVKIPKFSKSYGATATAPPPPPPRANSLQDSRDYVAAQGARARAIVEQAKYAKAQAAKALAAQQMIDDDDDKPLQIADASEADLADMAFQRHANKVSKILGKPVKYNEKGYEVGSGRRGGGTPDLATLALLAQGAQRGGARRTNKRGQAVAKVMRERGVSLPEASKIVKAEGLA